VGLTAGLNDMDKLKFLPPPGLELRPFGRPTRSQSLYRLRYPTSLHKVDIYLQFKSENTQICHFNYESYVNHNMKAPEAVPVTKQNNNQDIILTDDKERRA
jgi:hypothetical protein